MSATPKSISSPISRTTSFSPVSVAISPASKIAQSGNLTGLPRKIRDAVAEFYNLVQSWNKEHIEGCLVLQKISEAKKLSFLNSKNATNLQVYCDLLETSCNVLVDIVERMKQLSAEMEATQQLADMKNKNMAPLFLTWKISQFSTAFQEIYSAYSYELQVKKLVLSKVARSSNETALTFFVASWVHQPTLPSLVNCKLEAALVETGHS